MQKYRKQQFSTSTPTDTVLVHALAEEHGRSITTTISKLKNLKSEEDIPWSLINQIVGPLQFV